MTEVSNDNDVDLKYGQWLKFQTIMTWIRGVDMTDISNDNDVDLKSGCDLGFNDNDVDQRYG